MFQVMCDDCKAELPGSPFENKEKAEVFAEAFGIRDGVCELCRLMRKL